MKALCLVPILSCFLLGVVAPQIAYAQSEAVDREAAEALMAPGQPPLRGKEAIAAYLASTAGIPGFAINWEPVEAHVSASGDMACLLERNRVTYADSTGAPVTEHNKVVTVWRREEDGTWKNVVDMWNADPTPRE